MILRGHLFMVPTDLGAAMVVGPGLKLDNFILIPDAASLPFYPSVLKPVVCEGAETC